MHQIHLVLALLWAALLVGCEDSSTPAVEDDYYRNNDNNATNNGTNNTVPVTLSVEPTSGRPGQTISLSSEEIDLTAYSALTVEIAGVTMDAFPDDDGRWLAAIPIVYQDGWHVAPAVPVSVTLIDESPIAIATRALTIDALDKAPGASADLNSDLERAKAAIVSGASFRLSPGEDAMRISGVDRGTTALLGAQATVLTTAAEKAESFAIFEALIKSSGVLDATAEYADGLEELAAQLDNADDEFVFDFQSLAVRMQFYAIANGISRVKNHEALNRFASGFGMLSTARAYDPDVSLWLQGATEIAGPTIALAGIFNFVIYDYLLGLMPASVTSLDFEIDESDVGFRESVRARAVKLVTLNAPAQTDRANLEGFIVTSLGVPAITELSQLTAADVTSQLNVLVAAAQVDVESYAAANTIEPMDFSLVDGGESRQWTTRVVEPSFMLQSLSSDMAVVEAQYASWRSQTMTGESEISLGTGGNSDATLLGVAGAPYSGGAFGHEQFTSTGKTVRVGPRMVVEFNYLNPVAVNDVAPLTSRVGFLDVNGLPVWAAGVQVSATASSATLDVATGATDANGEFTVMVRPSKPFAQVELTFTDDIGRQKQVQVGVNFLSDGAASESSTTISDATEDLAQGRDERAVAFDLFSGGVSSYYSMLVSEGGDASAAASSDLSFANVESVGNLLINVSGQANSSARRSTGDLTTLAYTGTDHVSRFEAVTAMTYDLTVTTTGSITPRVDLTCDRVPVVRCNSNEACAPSYTGTLPTGSCTVYLGAESTSVILEGDPNANLQRQGTFDIALTLTPQ